MRKFLSFVLPIFVACNNVTDKKEIDNHDTINKQTKIRLPNNEFEITERGIGNLLLGDDFNSIKEKFLKVDTLSMSSEGFNWPAKSIDLGNGEWILVESNDGGKYISRIHTNSKKYKTTKGFYVGQIFDKIVKSGEKIGIEINEGFMSIRLYGEKVSIHIDSVSEKHFYDSKNQNINDIPNNAKIVEFGIY